MKTTVVLAIAFASFTMVHLHNTPPKQPTVEVIEVQEVVHKPPVKEVKPAPAVALDVTLVKDRIHQSWPLLCLLPKAYLLKPSLKLACPKLAVAATSTLVKKLAAQGPVRVNVDVVKPGHKHPVRVVAV